MNHDKKNSFKCEPSQGNEKEHFKSHVKYTEVFASCSHAEAEHGAIGLVIFSWIGGWLYKS